MVIKLSPVHFTVHILLWFILSLFSNFYKHTILGTVVAANNNIDEELEEDDEDDVETFKNANQAEDKIKGEVTRLQLGGLLYYKSVGIVSRYYNYVYYNST